MGDLLDHIHYVKKGREALPAVSSGHDWETTRAAHRVALEKLVEAIGRDLPKVKIDENWNGARVSIAGIRATSTSGLAGALGNWVAAAYRHLDKASGLSDGPRENVR